MSGELEQIAQAVESDGESLARRAEQVLSRLHDIGGLWFGLRDVESLGDGPLYVSVASTTGLDPQYQRVFAPTNRRAAIASAIALKG